jgi:hypothetical protein
MVMLDKVFPIRYTGFPHEERDHSAVCRAPTCVFDPTARRLYGTAKKRNGDLIVEEGRRRQGAARERDAGEEAMKETPKIVQIIPTVRGWSYSPEQKNRSPEEIGAWALCEDNSVRPLITGGVDGGGANGLVLPEDDGIVLSPLLQDLIK